MTVDVTRFTVVKGYLQLKEVDPVTGEVIREGGFVEDPEKGALYAVLDTQTKKIVDGSFKLSRSYRLAKQYEKGKPVIAALSDLTPRLSTVTLREGGKMVTYKPEVQKSEMLQKILANSRRKPAKTCPSTMKRQQTKTKQQTL